MTWISIPIVCLVEDLEADEIREANEILEHLNLPVKELPAPAFEIRKAELNINHIVTYYPSHNTERTILECINTNYSVALKKEVLKKIIAKAEGNG